MFLQWLWEGETGNVRVQGDFASVLVQEYPASFAAGQETPRAFLKSNTWSVLMESSGIEIWKDQNPTQTFIQRLLRSLACSPHLLVNSQWEKPAVTSDCEWYIIDLHGKSPLCSIRSAGEGEYMIAHRSHCWVVLNQVLCQSSTLHSHTRACSFSLSQCLPYPPPDRAPHLTTVSPLPPISTALLSGTLS
jgi:hypothetical protein